MKKNPVLMLLAAPLLLSVLAFRPANKVEPVSAYDKGTLPTTINLNDFEEGDIRSYYSNLNSLNESERRGTNLLKNLKPILKNNQKYFSYESGDDFWKMYEITDRDWSKSPVSSISQGTYDKASNTITGYKYGKDNPYIHALYVNRDVENETKAYGDHNQDQWGINREHIWPKGAGFNAEGSGGARGDAMHLWAGNGKVNGTYHSNYYYGYVDKTKDYDDAKDYASTLSGNLKGYSKTLGGKVTVFEPQDCDKGDIARACFYMVARYNFLSGSDEDGIDTNNPNLELVNELASFSEKGYQSTTTKTGKLGLIQDLLEWNRLDPVDGYELHRNNLLHRNFTNNRNPFIDFPEWADYIWGENSENKSANPTTDQIAEPKDFVPQTAKDDGLLFGLPKLYVYIGAAVVGVIALVVIIGVLAKGSKKQKKALKKVGKKVIRSTSKSKKKK